MVEASERLTHPVLDTLGWVTEFSHWSTRLQLPSGGQLDVTVDPGDMRTQMHQDGFPGEDISDRPLPDVTLPFWAWLLGQEPATISGRRFQAQAERWEVTA